jgi:hypothetical protein
MYEGLGGDNINKGVEPLGINQAKGKHNVSSKACERQLGALKRDRLDSSIALDCCIGQELEDPKGSSRVVSERQSLVLFWKLCLKNSRTASPKSYFLVVVASTSSFGIFYEINLRCS